MKVTLDLSKLLQEGSISPEEHERLARLGRHDTGLLLVNVLVGFGVFAVSGGAVALLPNALTGVALGGCLMAVGASLMMSGRHGWSLLANICILVAALLLGTGIVLLSQGVTGPATIDGPQAAAMPLPAALLLVAAIFAAAGALARSSLLAVLTVLVLFAALGSTTGYRHASYDLEVQEPLATILAFSALALAAHAASRTVRGDWERLCTMVARTALFLVNLGFWIGSLWGDGLDWLRGDMAISAVAFAIAWAVALVPVAVWAGLSNRRWVLNLVTVFGGIHFYTQWFERLGATPISILAAGVLMLAFAIGLWKMNRRMPAPTHSQAAPGGISERPEPA